MSDDSPRPRHLTRLEPVSETLPTWEDVERAALHCPVLARLVAYVRSNEGTVTREQALIWAVLFLSKERADSLAREVDRLKHEPAPSFRR
jgi:hypothetical protein